MSHIIIIQKNKQVPRRVASTTNDTLLHVGGQISSEPSKDETCGEMRNNNIVQLYCMHCI